MDKGNLVLVSGDSKVRKDVRRLLEPTGLFFSIGEESTATAGIKKAVAIGPALLVIWDSPKIDAPAVAAVVRLDQTYQRLLIVAGKKSDNLLEWRAKHAGATVMKNNPSPETVAYKIREMLNI